MRNVKIVATIGPHTCNTNSLLRLKENGMSIVRLNGSHNNLSWHCEAIRLIQQTLPEIPILLDIPGRKIRTIGLKIEPSFLEGDTIILTTDQSHDGTYKVPVNYKDLHVDVKIGQLIYADDGTLNFSIVKIQGQDIHVRANSAGKLKSKKGINVPFVKLNTALVTLRDKEMIQFAQEMKVDYIGLSFVESKKHVEAIRNLILPYSFPGIISKIENQGGLDNMNEIIEASDGIMIDRGDLSVETELTTIALAQKDIIKFANKYAKPVIVATEMLHSMIENSYPTKAEVADITNAVIDGCSAVMLSGETAVGKYPFEAVALMDEVIKKTEIYKRNLLKADEEISELDLKSRASKAIEILCLNSPITKIVAITRSGYAARSLAVRNLVQPIIAVSDDLRAAHRFSLFSGVEGIFYDKKFPKDSLNHISEILHYLYSINKISKEDFILITGAGYPISGSRMNFIQMHKISDLIETLKW